MSDDKIVSLQNDVDKTVVKNSLSPQTDSKNNNASSKTEPLNLKNSSAISDELPSEDKESASGKKAKKTKKNKRRGVGSGKVSIYATFNNVIVTIADPYGNVIASSSAGASGFKGPKKSTPYAAKVTAENAGKKAQELFGFKEAEVTLSGAGPGRDSALRGLNSVGITIKTLCYKSVVAHGGCRPRKARRV